MTRIAPFRRPRVSPALIASVTVLGFRLLIGLDNKWPHIFPDELGYLGAARLFAGARPDFYLDSVPYYHPLYSYLIAPIFNVAIQSQSAYTSILIVNALLGAAGTFALYQAGRRVFQASPFASSLSAIVAGLYPGQALLTNAAWAENLLPVCITLWVVVMTAWLTKPTLLTSCLVVFLSLACYWAHPRGIIVLALAAGTGALLAASKKTNWRPQALLVLLGASLGYYLSIKTIPVLLQPLYAQTPSDLSTGEMFSRIAHPGNWPNLMVRSMGQLWYLSIGTTGLAIVGIMSIVARLGRLLDPRKLGRREVPQILASSLVLLVALLLLLVSSAVLARGVEINTYAYGRYIDSVAPLLIVAGVIGIINGNRRRIMFLLSTSIAITVVVAAVLLWVVPDQLDHVSLVPDMLLGIVAYIGLTGTLGVIPLSLIGLSLFIGFGGIALYRQSLAIVLISASFAIVGVATDRLVLSRYNVSSGTLQRFAASVVADSESRPIGIDVGKGAEDLAVLGYQWFEPKVDMYDIGQGAIPSSPWLVGPLRWPLALGMGAELVRVDPARPVGLWVRPGSELTAMRRQGALLPPEFPSVLPASAIESRLSGPDAVVLTYSGSQRVQVEVEHVGSRFRWPSAHPDGGQPFSGLVRLGARIWAGSTTEGLPVMTLYADLPSDLLPGQRAHVEMAIPSGSPASILEPGEYTIKFDMIQVGSTWFEDRGQQPHVTRLKVVR